MKIKTKLLVAFLVAVLVPVLLVAVITTRDINKNSELQFAEASSLNMAVINNTFVNFFEYVGYTVSALAEHPSVTKSDAGPISTYFGEEQRPSEVARASGGRELEIFELFSSIGNNNPSLVYVYMGDKQGGYLEWPGTAEYGNWDSRNRPWFDIGKNANYSVVRRDGYYYAPDDAVYIAVLRAFKGKNGSFEGVVGIDFSLKTLTKMVQEVKFGETGYLMVVEGNGNILVDAAYTENNFKALSSLDSPHYQVIDKTDSGVVELEVDGVGYMANIYHSKELGWKFIGLMQKREIFAEARQMTISTAIVCTILVIVFGLFGVFIANRIVSPINSVKDNLRTIAEGEGDLTTRINVESNDETGELADWFNQFIESTQRMIVAIKKTSVEMDNLSDQTNARAMDMAEASSQQLQSVDQVVTAVTEMSAAANEVAKNCVDTANVSEEGLSATVEGKEIINRSAKGVTSLGQSIKTSNQVIQELEKETANINSILGTIQDIAEQTNLLALNAAIEAARAGEQGRGFAVVADEVRNLAKRTQDSTEEINTILKQLVDKTKEVSENMDTSLTESETAVGLSGDVLTAFENIENSVEKIRDMTTQTASATEEQHLVTEDINKNTISISEFANKVSELSTNVESLCREQNTLSSELNGLVSRFNTGH